MSHHHRTAAAMALAAAVALGAAVPATADDDPGPPAPIAAGGCPLERVGTQLVRCDDLTGADAKAPPWIPERV